MQDFQHGRLSRFDECYYLNAIVTCLYLASPMPMTPFPDALASYNLCRAATVAFNMYAPSPLPAGWLLSSVLLPFFDVRLHHHGMMFCLTDRDATKSFIIQVHAILHDCL